MRTLNSPARILLISIFGLRHCDVCCQSFDTNVTSGNVQHFLRDLHDMSVNRDWWPVIGAAILTPLRPEVVTNVLLSLIIFCIVLYVAMLCRKKRQQRRLNKNWDRITKKCINCQTKSMLDTERSFNEIPGSSIKDVSWNPCRHLSTDAKTTDLNYLAATNSVDTLKSQTLNTPQGEKCEMIYNCCGSRDTRSSRLADAKSTNGRPRANRFKHAEKFRKCDVSSHCCSERFPMSNSEHCIRRLTRCKHKKASVRNESCPMEDGTKYVSHRKDEFNADENAATLENAESLDFYSGVDQDWQRIWLHIKPFGRRTPLGQLKGARSAEDEDVRVASGDTCILDKGGKLTDTHTTNNRRTFASSTCGEQSGANSDVAKRICSMRQNPDVAPASCATVDSNTNQNNHCDAWTPASGDGDLANGNRKSHSLLPGDGRPRGVTIHAVRDAQLGRNSPASRGARGKETPLTASASSGHCRREDRHLGRDHLPGRGLPSWRLNEDSLLQRVGDVFVGQTWRGDQWQCTHKGPVDAAAGDGRDLPEPTRLAWSSAAAARSVFAKLLAGISAKDILRPLKTRPGVVFSSLTSHSRHHKVSHSNDNTNNSNNGKYYTSDDSESDTDRLVTSYASYDNVSRRATVHQRRVSTAPIRSTYTRGREDNGDTVEDKRCSGEHAYYASKYGNDDDIVYTSDEEEELDTVPLLHGEEGDTSDDQEEGESSNSEDAGPCSATCVIVDEQSRTANREEGDSSAAAVDRPGQRLLRGEPVIVARVVKELCALLDYHHHGMDDGLVNAVAVAVNNMPVSRHILYQVFRYANHFATMYSDAAASVGDPRLDRRTISRMEQGLIGRGSLPQLAASFESVGVKLGLSGLTYGCRAVAYQLLNILAELETVEETADDGLLASISRGGCETEMLRRLLVDFLDPDGYARTDSPTQSDYDDEEAYWDDPSLRRARPTAAWSRPRHNNTDSRSTSVNNNNMTELSEHSIRGIIADLNEVKVLANDAVQGSQKIKAEGEQLYGKDCDMTDAKSEMVTVALSAWQSRVHDYVTQRGTAITVPESQRRKTISISYRLTTSCGDMRRHLPTWVSYVLLVLMAVMCISFEVGCVLVGRHMSTEEGHFWSIATISAILFDIIALQPLKVLLIAAVFTSRKTLL